MTMSDERQMKTRVKGVMKGFAGRLATIRGDRSQRQFARDLGVFQQNVNRYEFGTTPHSSFLIRLAIMEKVDINWLLTGRRAPAPGRASWQRG